MRFKSIGTAAVAAGLGLSLAACGSSSSSSASSGGSSSTAAASDTVTAINNLTGVGTSVILDPGTAKALTSLGVSLAPFGSAKFDSGTSTITFPITSGYAEIHSDKSVKPGYILGSVQHNGSGMTLSAGATKLNLENFVVDPGNSMLYGSVNGMGADLPIAFLDGSNLQVGNAGGNVTLDGTKVELTATAATALDQTFHTTAITPGLVLGTVHLVASGNATTYTDKTTDISRLTGQTTSLTLNTQTVQALTGLGVKLGTAGTAKLDASTGSVAFPITGGFAAIHSDKGVKPGYIAGALIHEGSGITLAAGGKTVTLSDFVVDPGDSMLYGNVTTGGPVMVDVPLLFLDGTNVQVTTPSDGTVHLDGTVAELTSTAANALNATFGTTALKEGIPLGVAHIIAAGTVSNG